MATPASDILVSVFARTDVGMLRSGNEDAFLVADLTSGNVGLGPEVITHSVGERGSLLIVSDGMGGAAAGEVASEIAVKIIRESLLDIPIDLATAERLKIATELANECIWNEAQRDRNLTGMGATVTAVLVEGATAYIAQVGDSRAYLIRGNRIKQLTKDQSYAQALRDSGMFSPEQISKVPQNVILQALGTQPTVQVGLTAVELHRNDYLIVCSDGLSGKINADEICDVVCQSTDLTSACRSLVDTANARGGEDNITVILASFDGVGLDAADESTSITGSFKSLSKDFRPAPPSADTEPLTSLPAPGDDSSTVVMPSLAAAGRTAPETATPSLAAAGRTAPETATPSLAAAGRTAPETATPKSAQDSISAEETDEAPASVPKQKSTTVALRRRQKRGKRATRKQMAWLITLLVLILLVAAGYLVYLFVDD